MKNFKCRIILVHCIEDLNQDLRPNSIIALKYIEGIADLFHLSLSEAPSGTARVTDGAHSYLVYQILELERSGRNNLGLSKILHGTANQIAGLGYYFDCYVDVFPYKLTL